MTNEEAINICEREQYCASHRVCTLEECPWNENCPDDAPFDSEIQEAFQMAIEALEAQRWIPCSERLPEDDTDVLISYRYKEGEGDTRNIKIDITSYGTMYFGGNAVRDYAKNNIKYWRPPFQYFNSNYEVLAWCELPEPWKGEQE